MKAALALIAAAAALGQPPKLVNARLETRSAAAGLEPAVRALMAGQTQPAWIGADRRRTTARCSSWHSSMRCAAGTRASAKASIDAGMLMRKTPCARSAAGWSSRCSQGTKVPATISSGGPAWVTRPGVRESLGTTPGCGREPRVSSGTSMIMLRSR